jgi:hypothetical protein
LPQLPALLKHLHQETAQNSIEYLLVIGGVAVLIMAGLMAGFPVIVCKVIALACPSIDPAAAGIVESGSCLLQACPL